MSKLVKILWICLATCLLCACGNSDNQQNKMNNTQKDWVEIKPDEVDINATKMFNDDWMVLSVGNKEKHNAMTISWGGMGELWNKPVITVYVSTSRYTYNLMEENKYFTVCTLPKDKRDALSYLGSHSGRNGADKIADAGLTAEYTDLGNVLLKEGTLAFECRLIYKAPFLRENIDPEIATFYDSGTGMHTMYIGEIVHVWKK